MQRERRWLALLCVLAAAAALFACGLPGGFIFDDFANLAGLERVDGTLRRLAIFLTEGASGGRPLSYLSFALQSASWPRDAQAFKLVNIALHLANGALLYVALHGILRLLREPRAAGIALGATAVWLVHPIQISSVLYVVQRMTELGALITLAGLAGYVHGRRLAAGGAARRGYTWMTLAVALATPIGVLAKENAVLLPLYVAVIEFTLLAVMPRPRRWGAWAAVFLALPLVALVVYIAASPSTMGGYGVRSFGPLDRLYTEAGILWDYLARIALPRPSAFGLFFDDYPVAAAPWHSLGTALAAGGWCVALGVAVICRNRIPALSFAILWYVAGHLLESTVLPLELYFEHRNYLPLVGPAVGVAWAVERLLRAASSASARRTYAALAGTLFLALCGVTALQAHAWSNPVRLAVYWAQERPGSQRAQFDLGTAYINAGRYRDADAVFARGQGLAPDEAQFLLARLELTCVAPELAGPPVNEVVRSLAGTPPRAVQANFLESMVVRQEEGTCRRLGVEVMLSLVDAYLTNPRLPITIRQAALYMKGRLHALQGNLDAAVRSLEAGDGFGPNLRSVQFQATWLLSAELYQDALNAVLRARSDARWPAAQRPLYAPFLAAWERQIRSAAQQRGVSLREGA